MVYKFIIFLLLIVGSSFSFAKEQKYYIDSSINYVKIPGEYQYAEDYSNTKLLDFYIKDDQLYIKNPKKYNDLKLFVVKKDGTSEIIIISYQNNDKKIQNIINKNKKNKLTVFLKGSAQKNDKFEHLNNLITNVNYDNQNIKFDLYNFDNKEDFNYYFKYENFRKNNLVNKYFFEYGFFHNDFQNKKFKTIGLGFDKDQNSYYVSKFVDNYNYIWFASYKNNRFDLFDKYDSKNKKHDLEFKINDNFSKLSYLFDVNTFNNISTYNYNATITYYANKGFLDNLSFMYNEENSYKNIYENYTYSVYIKDFSLNLRSNIFNKNGHQLNNFINYSYKSNGYSKDSNMSDNIQYVYDSNRFRFQYNLLLDKSVKNNLLYRINFNENNDFSIKYSNDSVINSYGFDWKFHNHIFENIIGYNSFYYMNGLNKFSVNDVVYYNINDKLKLKFNYDVSFLNNKINQKTIRIESNIHNYGINNSVFKIGYEKINFTHYDYDNNKMYINYTIPLYEKDNIQSVFLKRIQKEIFVYEDVNYNQMFDNNDGIYHQEDLEFKIKNNNVYYNNVKIFKKNNKYYIDYYGKDNDELELSNVNLDYKINNFSFDKKEIEIGIQKYKKLSIKTMIKDEYFNDILSYDVECSNGDKYHVKQNGYIEELNIKETNECDVKNISTEESRYNFDIGEIEKEKDSIIVKIIPKTQLLFFITKNNNKGGKFIIKINNKKLEYKGEMIEHNYNFYQKREDNISITLIYDTKKYDCNIDYYKKNQLHLIKNEPIKIKIDFICN